MGVIRLFLALSVVVWHLWGHALPFTANGYNVVILFFIISGFYMSMVINDKYSNASTCKYFYLARALRIYPLYLLYSPSDRSGFCVCDGKPASRSATTDEWLFSTLTNITIFGIPWLSNWDWLAIPPAWTPRDRAAILPWRSVHRDTPTYGYASAILLGLIAVRLSLLDQDFTYWRYTYPPRGLVLLHAWRRQSPPRTPRHERSDAQDPGWAADGRASALPASFAGCRSSRTSTAPSSGYST